MRMRKNNPLNAAVNGAPHRIDVRRDRRPRIDDPTLDDVAVRPVQG